MLKSLASGMCWFVLVALASSAAPALAQGEASTNDRGYELGFYGWLAGLEGTMGFGRVNDVPVNASFSDIASFVDFSMAGYFEARRPKYIIGTDIFWVKLGATRTGHINGSDVDVDFNMDQYIAALGGAYRWTPQVDLWLTGRLYSLQNSLTFQGSNLAAASKTWGDVYIGARYHVDFAQRWIALARADIGTGGSDFAWYGNVAVGYHFTPTFTLGAAYRVLSLDRETGSNKDYFKYDIVEDGLGIVFSFSL
jgi:hypothetical protein